MRQHLTQEEIIKYMDTTDLSEEYALWLEEAQTHVDDCVLCQEQLRRFLTIEHVCEADMLTQSIAWMEKESDVRRNMVLFRLEMLGQNERIQRVRQAMLQGQFAEYVIRQSQIGRRKSIFRGSDTDTPEQTFCVEYTDTGIRMKFDNPAMTGHELICESDNAQNIQLCKIVWNEEIGVAIADAEGIGDMSEYHIYIL
ncbi:MAG: hypothetical protein PUD20_05770 [bacterium]|nr:hypothetical protein [bacterium]